MVLAPGDSGSVIDVFRANLKLAVDLEDRVASLDIPKSRISVPAINPSTKPRKLRGQLLKVTVARGHRNVEAVSLERGRNCVPRKKELGVERFQADAIAP